MRTVRIEITGNTPLMHHRMTEDQLFGLLGTKTKQLKDKTEQVPREIAEKHAYKNKKGEYYVPAEYICGAVASVASDYKQSNSAKRTLKSVARSVFRPVVGELILLDHKNKPLKEFEVDVRKGTNHKAGAVAICRPRFDEWRIQFDANISDELVSPETMQLILEDAGRRSGIGSFRVSKGGIFGQFRLTRFEELKS